MGALYRLLANEYILNHLFGSSVTFPELNPTRYDPFSSSSSRTRYNVSLAQRTLASAALTCRAFSAPASYALWKVIDSGLVALVHTLPNLDKCVREVRDKDKKPTFYALRGDVSEVEWTRFEQVAKQVRSLALFKDTRLSPEVVQAIVTRYDGNGPPLFPNLQILSWMNSSCDPLWQRIFHIALQSVPPCLIYSSRSRSGNELSIAADVASTIPNLVLDEPHIRSTANTHLLKFVDLRSLKLECNLQNGLQVLEHIASLPHLESLSCLCVYPESLDPTNYRSLMAAGFPSLRVFTLLEGGLSSNFLLLLSRITSPLLTSLSASVIIHNRDEVAPFVDKMCSLPVVQHLKTLSLAFVTSRRYVGYDPPFQEIEGSRDISFATFSEPFYRLHDVEDFSLFSRKWRFAVSDTDLSQIADAWPHLRTLKLWSSHLRRDRSGGILPPVAIERPSLYAAVRLPERCPGLRIAKVELSGVTDEEAHSLEKYIASPAFRPHRAMQEIVLGRQDDVKDPVILPADLDRFALLLHRVFPCLSDPDGWYDRIDFESTVCGRLGGEEDGSKTTHDRLGLLILKLAKLRRADVEQNRFVDSTPSVEC